MPVLVVRIDESAFDVIAGRSVAASFWSWLAASAAEFGLDLLPADASPARRTDYG